MVAKYLQALSARGVQQALKRCAVKVLGEEWGVLVTPHKFRHTHATELLNEGFTLLDVQRRLGHSRLDPTQVYREVDDEALAAKTDARPGTDEQPEPDTESQELAAKIAAMTPEVREAVRALFR